MMSQAKILSIQLSLPQSSICTSPYQMLYSFLCGDLKQTGLLCSKCQHALGAAVLSYRPQCGECLDGCYGWLVYTAAVLLPSTLFCFVVIVFQAHATTAYMNAFIFYASSLHVQAYFFQPFLTTLVLQRLHTFLFMAVLTFYGFWNLDFFQYFISSFCISSQMNTLSTLAQKYVIAIYPLFF